MSTPFRMDMSGLINGLVESEDRAQAAIKRYADTSAEKLEAYAKQNARWQNHTGDARRRLKGDSLPVQNGYKLRLAHGVDYGIFLEMAHERRFAIIEETIQRLGSTEIMPGFEHLLDRLGGSNDG